MVRRRLSDGAGVVAIILLECTARRYASSSTEPSAAMHLLVVVQSIQCSPPGAFSTTLSSRVPSTVPVE